MTPLTPPPVLRLVPGLGLDEAAWRPTVESLPSAWRRDLEVAVLPGYGEPATRAADLRPAALAEILLDRWCPPDATARHESAGEVPTLVRQYARTGLWTMARAMDAARRDDVRESVRGSRCPVLVVRGPRDRICPAD